jgi:predicted O-methyltransferase YrrM
MSRHFLKFWLYLDKEMFIEAVSHPLKTMRNIRSLTSQSDYLTFVSSITGSSIAKCKSFMPSSESEKLLLSAFRKSISPKSGQHSCTPDEALSLYLLTRILKPRYVVETGVSAGRSSSYMLCALRDNEYGELFSIDPDSAAGYAIPQKLKERWHFTNDTSEKTLPNLLEQLRQIDIFFHDSLHTYENMMFEFDTAWPHLNKNGLIIADNVNWNNAINDFYQKINRTPIYLNVRFACIRNFDARVH